MTCTRWFLLLAPACLLLASCQGGPMFRGATGPSRSQAGIAQAPESHLPTGNLAIASSSSSNRERDDHADDNAKHGERRDEKLATVLSPNKTGGPSVSISVSARTLSDNESPLPSPALDADSENPIQLVAYGSHVPRVRGRKGSPEAWMCQPTDIYGNWDNWRPPGIRGPWPADEYICDGGDRLLPVIVERDWTVKGIDQEDTIAHYDTLAGKTIVQPSNRVCIYAPRFAAVRQVTGVMLDEGSQWAAGVTLPVPPISQDLHEGPEAVTQPVQPERNLAVTPPYAFLDRLPAMGVDNVRSLQGIDFQLLPHEELLALEEITLDATQKARLAEKTIAAKVWETATGIQVLIDHQAAVEVVRDTDPQEVLCYDMPKGKPRLEIIKIASKQNALPGDLVEFTLRYENVGTEEIGNVTIIDSLTTRLEYVADTAQSTRNADFFAVENEGDSLLLRWELKEPLKTGEGGLIRFQTRVR